MVSRVIPVDAFDLVVFGGTGDLAKRKILPALFRRFCSGQMEENSRIIGAARSDLGRDEYRQLVAEAINDYNTTTKCELGTLEAFLEQIDYVHVDARGDEGWQELADLMQPGKVRAFYFSVGPAFS